MARRRNLLRAIRRKLAKSSCRATDVDVQSCGLEGEASDASGDDRSVLVGEDGGRRGGGGARPPEYSDAGASLDGALVAAPDGVAAAVIKVQAAYRGHLARRAFRALRGVVRMQAVVRGFCVRRQVRAAMQCMQVLVRLQVRVRTRQLLGGAPAPAAAQMSTYSE